MGVRLQWMDFAGCGTSVAARVPRSLVSGRLWMALVLVGGMVCWSAAPQPLARDSWISQGRLHRSAQRFFSAGDMYSTELDDSAIGTVWLQKKAPFSCARPSRYLFASHLARPLLIGPRLWPRQCVRGVPSALCDSRRWFPSSSGRNTTRGDWVSATPPAAMGGGGTSILFRIYEPLQTTANASSDGGVKSFRAEKRGTRFTATRTT